MKFKGINNFKMFVKNTYKRQGGFTNDHDALTIFYSKTLNDFTPVFLIISSDFDKIRYWRISKTFIWRYRTHHLGEYRLLLSLSYSYSPNYVTFGMRNDKIILLSICGIPANRRRDGCSFFGGGVEKAHVMLLVVCTMKHLISRK
jgi:hypothetical protein